MTDVDDRTAAYVIDVHPQFEDLRHVAAQIAGVLVLAASGSKEASPHHPMLDSANQVRGRAADAVTRSTVLVSERSRRHHRHLVDASQSLAAALASCGTWPIDIDAVLVPLRDAYGHLWRASKALPGFQMVSFEQACCGYSLSRRNAETTITAEHAEHAEEGRSLELVTTAKVPPRA